MQFSCNKEYFSGNKSSEVSIGSDVCVVDGCGKPVEMANGRRSGDFCAGHRKRRYRAGYRAGTKGTQESEAKPGKVSGELQERHRDHWARFRRSMDEYYDTIERPTKDDPTVVQLRADWRMRRAIYRYVFDKDGQLRIRRRDGKPVK